jgi:uncharacterized membrane protein HdeD (DUF308 family)
MSARNLERLTWVLIYGGILLGCLGLFARDAAPTLGTALLVVGALDIVAGLLCIVIRSRMRPAKPSGTPIETDKTNQTDKDRS